jgi:ABC-type uncharacterized transport system ATPase subunit
MEDDDPDLLEERHQMSHKHDGELALACRSLYKFYTPEKCAVHNLTFGIDPNSCFGLLGVNGAGKVLTHS